MDYQGLAWFTEVVRAGSFSGAAAKLAVGKSTLSERVSALERAMGVALLQRTTRKLHLTDAGQRLFDAASRSLAELEAAHAEALAGQQIPRGLLRITAPLELAGSEIPRALVRALEKWPELRLELDFSDRVVDLVGEGFDIALRAGELDDSNLKAKRLTSSAFVLGASPGYIKARGAPKDPSELAAHRILAFSPFGDEWELVADRGRRKLARFTPYVSSPSMAALKSLVLDGAGIALLPAFYCQKETKEGSLARVLPEWSTRKSPFHLVYANHAIVPPKIRLVIPVLEKALASLSG